MTRRVLALFPAALALLATSRPIAATGPVGEAFVPMMNCRSVDTRGPAGPNGGPSLGANEVRVFTIKGTCGVSANALGLVINVTVINPAAAGYAQLFAGDAPVPPTIVLAFKPHQTRAGFALVALSSDGNGTIALANGSSGPADFLIDVLSYTIPACTSTITVTNPGTATGTVNTPFSQTFTAAGGVGTKTFTTASPLPAGMTLAANGTLSGTPTQSGTFPIVVTATDANGCKGSGPTYTLVIACQTITVTNPAVSTGTANAAFSQTFTQTGGVGATTFSTPNALPTGMTLAANGVLSGTPTQTGVFLITVTATDANGCTGAGATYTLTINCQTITVTKPATATGTAGTPFSQTFTQSGAIGTATFTTASTLPTGLSLSPAGVLSGTPTQTGTFPIVVTVTDANGCKGTSATYNLVINCELITVQNPAVSTATATVPFSQTFTQVGAIGTATFTTASTLPNGITLAANGVLSGTPTQTGSFPIVVTVTDANGCVGVGVTYTLVVSCQTYSVQPTSVPAGTAGTLYPAVAFKHAGGIDPVTFTEVGALPTGMSFVAGLLTGTPTQTGSFPFTVTATDVNGCTASRDYVLVVSCVGVAITLAPASLPAVVVGSAFPATTFTGSGGTGAYTFQQIGTLPNGMQFVTDTLSGTPTQTGAFPITIVATDAAGCVGSQDYVVTVTCVGVTITVAPPTVPSVAAGSPFGPVTFTGSGGTGPYTFVKTGVLPTGMNFGPNTLSGSPTQQGTFPFTITATDANGCSGSTSYSLVVTCPTITVTNPGVSTGTVSTPFSQTFTQSGGALPVTFSLASGTLPTGLTLSTGGVLSGTPTQSGSFPITVKVTDTNGCTSTGTTYTLVISCQTITVTNPVVNSGTDGTPFLQTFTQTGGIGATTFTLASGSLPSGWSLTPAGVLANAAPTPVVFSITVKVTDSNGCTGTGGTYTVTIVPLAGNDTYAPPIVGNTSIDTSTGTVFSVLSNDSAGATATLTSPAAHGTVLLAPTGTFTYAPNRGYQGPDSFTYTATVGGIPSAPATVSLTVAGVVWFVNDNPGACVAACDGRNATPYTTLAAFQIVNDGTGTNPKTGDRIFLYESNPPNPYVGPVTLQNGQFLIGQDFSGTFATATGLAVPDTTVNVPVMNSVNAFVTEVTNGPGLNGINLVTDAAVIGLRATASSGVAISQALAPPAVGAAALGTTILSEVVIQTTGVGTALKVLSTTGTLLYPTGSIGASGSNSVSAVFIQGGTSAITIGVPITSAGAGNISISQRGAGASTTFNGQVTMTGTATGIAIGGLTGPSSVAFNALVQLGTGPGSRMTGAGGIALDVNHSGTASTTTFANLSLFTNNMTGVNTQTNGTLNIATGSLDVTGGRALSVSNVALGMTLTSITQAAGSGGGAAISLSGSSGFLTSAVTNLTGASTQGIAVSSAAGTVDFGSTTIAGSGSQGILVSGSTANVNFGNTIINGGTDAVSLQNNSNGTRTFGALTIGNTAAPSGIGFLHAVGGGNTTVSGAASITNPVGLGVSVDGLTGTQAINFNSSLSVTKSSGTAVALGTTASNSLAGTVNLGVLSVSASNGTAILAGSGGTSTPLTTSGAGVVTATNGPAINATSTTFNSSFGSVSSTNSTTQGITLTGALGTLTMNGGSIAGAAGTAFNLSGGSANVTYAGSITQNAAQFAVAATGMTGGTKTFSGNVTSITNGKGISLTTNTGATIAFTGTLNLSTGTNPAFTATGGGTVTATGAGSTLTTTTGTALNVASTTIGGAGLTFQSISSNGASSGIILNTTGAGGLTVTGDAGSTNNNSGGTIQNSTNVGISLSNAQNISLDQMNIQNTTHSGIDGTQVANFSFTNGTINSAGNQLFESCIAFNGTNSQVGNNISGTLTVTGSTLTNPFYSGLDIQSDNGTITNANVSNNTITNTGGLGINFSGINNTTTVFNLQNATINHNNITQVGGTGIQTQCSASNTTGPGAVCGVPGDATKIISITNNTVVPKSTGTQAITVANSGGNAASRTKTNFLVQCNGNSTGICNAAGVLNGSSIGTVILIGNNGFADMTGTVDLNVIVANHTPNGGGGNGIAGGNGVAGSGNAWTPSLTLTVTNNAISQTDGNGILLVGRGTSGSFSLKLSNNSAATPLNAGGSAREGIRVDAGNATSADDAVCLHIFGNTSAGSNGAAGIGVRKQGTVATTNDFGIQGIGIAAPSNAQVQAFIDAQNPAGGGTDIINGSAYVDCGTAP